MKRKKKQKKGSFRIFSSKLFLFLLVIMLAGLGKATFDKYFVWKDAKSALNETEAKIQTEKEKKENLQKQKDEIQNEDYLKRVVKEKLNLVEPGEKVIYILPENQEPPTEETSNKNLGEKLKEIFIKNDEQ